MSWTLTTSGSAIAKAGAGVSAALTQSGSLLAKWSDDCEASLNAITRKDWIAGYANVTANFKGILSDTVSSMIAFNMINYDSSGYTSREAERMLDVQRDIITRNVNVLEKDNIKEVMD